MVGHGLHELQTRFSKHWHEHPAKRLLGGKQRIRCVQSVRAKNQDRKQPKRTKKSASRCLPTAQYPDPKSEESGHFRIGEIL